MAIGSVNVKSASGGGDGSLTPNFNDIIWVNSVNQIIEAGTVLAEAEGEGELLSLLCNIQSYVPNGTTQMYNYFDISIFIDDVEYRFDWTIDLLGKSSTVLTAYYIPLKRQHLFHQPADQTYYTITNYEESNGGRITFGGNTTSAFYYLEPKANVTQSVTLKWVTGGNYYHVRNTDAFNFKKSIKVVINKKLVKGGTNSAVDQPTLRLAIGLY